MRSRRVMLGVLTIVFVASAAMTIAWGRSMSAMGEMQMPGGWTMSPMWMLMPGQSWLAATASFVGMWVVMMGAMMLPSLIPALLCYRESVATTGGARSTLLTALVASGYFVFWSVPGAIVFPLGVVIAGVTMRDATLSRGIPFAIGAAVLVAGVFQQSGWKARLLAACRQHADPLQTSRHGAGAAFLYGIRLGIRCCGACAGLMTAALALGVMDTRVMAAATAAIALERLTPAGVFAARAIGMLGIGAGAVLVVRAAGGAW